MEKNILVPTDFTVRSLAILPKVVSLNTGARLNVLLFHVLKMSYNLTELLFVGRYAGEHNLISKDFAEACEILEKKYQGQRLSINTRIAYGDTQRYVKNILEAEEIEEIYMHEDIILSLPDDESVPMQPLLGKSGLPITYVSNYEIEHGSATLNTLSIEQFKSLT